jgi:hypothetical protein
MVGGGTLRDKFLVFRGLLLGEIDREQPGKGLGGTNEKSSEDVMAALLNERGIICTDESGEESGVWSSVIADSTVEMVVVGEEFVDDDGEVDALPFCRCKGCCSDIGPGGTPVMAEATALFEKTL